MRLPFARKTSKTFRAIVAYYSGQPVYTDTKYAGVSREGYGKNPYVYACVRTIAMSCAGIPWGVYVKRGKQWIEYEGESGNVAASKLYTLWNKPNPQHSLARLIERTASFLELSGNNYTECNGPESGPPMELYALRPDRMTIVPGDAQNPIARYEYRANNEVEKFDRNKDGTFNILHMPYFHPLDDWYGLPPAFPAIRSLDQNNSSKDWNLALLQNGAVPSGFIKKEEDLSDSQFERLQQLINERFAGPLNAGRPMTLEGGMSWQQGALSPLDMSWLEGLKLSAREIAIAFGVAPELIGDAANKTHANYAEARLALYQENLLPKMDWFRDEYNSWLTPRFGDNLRLDYKRDEIEALQEDRDKLWVRVNTASYLSVNEKRNEVGYDDIPGGDVVLVPLSLVPVGTAQIREELQGEKSGGGRYAVKSWNLQTVESKRAYWKATNRNRDQWAQSVKRLIAAQFDVDRKRVVKEVSEASTEIEAIARARRVITNSRDDWRKVYRQLYLTVAEDFGNRTLAGLEDSVKASNRIMFRRKDAEDVYIEAVNEWIDEFTGENIVNITATELAQIQAAIAAAFNEGISIAEVAARIDELYLEQIIPNRSETIARTEVGIASNLGTQEAALATGLNLEKVWITEGDDKVRDGSTGDFDHVSMDGIQIPIDDPYDVSGEEMYFPMDTSQGASAGNIINCRCVESYYIVETGDFFTAKSRNNGHGRKLPRATRPLALASR